MTCRSCGLPHGVSTSCHEATHRAAPRTGGLGSAPMLADPETRTPLRNAERRLRLSLTLSGRDAFEAFVPEVLSAHGLLPDDLGVAAMVAAVRDSSPSASKRAARRDHGLHATAAVGERARQP
jgi:hypothetical protein